MTSSLFRVLATIMLLLALPLCHSLAGATKPATAVNPADANSALNAGIVNLQHQWEIIQYQTPEGKREAMFATLADTAQTLVASFPQHAEPLIWQGIILSSWAGAKGGLGALGLAKKARAAYEAAIRIDAKALQGSALNSLGVLYYKVPGWPLGFGDKDKAGELIQQALTINPTGIDPNYFYADYLMARKRPAEAIPYLERALQAPPRPGREIADAGRRAEARKLLAEAREDAR